GVKLRDNHDWAGAIREFLEVLKHDQSVGAWLNLGACYETTREYRRAVEAFEKGALAARKKSDERFNDATDAAKKIRDNHPWIIVSVGRDVAALEGLEIRVDDVPVPKEEYGGEVFRPRSGRHTVLVTTRDREGSFTANDRDVVEVKLDALHPKSDKPPPPPPPGGEDHDGGGWSWQKWTGLGLVIASALPIALSIKWALDNQSDQDNIGTQYHAPNAATDSSGQTVACSGNHDSNARGTNGKPLPVEGQHCIDLEKQFESNQTQARQRLIPGFAIGGLMLIGGVVLFILAPSGAPAQPSSGKIDVRFAPTPGGGVVFGRF
ncbi:MAG TPA: tetratricopeptide repeat protein, partial [Labilithrix sp.]